MQIVNQLQELIDTKTRQLDIDFKNLDYTDDIPQEPLPKLARSSSPTNSNQGGNGVRNEYGAYGSSTTHQRGSTPTSQNSERNSSNGERNFNGKRTRRPRNDMDNDSHSASENSSSVKNNGNNSGANGSLNVSGGAGNAAGSSKNSKSGQSSGNSGSSSSKQKKKRKARQGREREESPPPDHIDPDEPTYCLCDQVGLNVVLKFHSQVVLTNISYFLQISFGEMILCDNDLCPIEWFHFSCVQLVSKPKGKWFCPNCRGDRVNMMKPKAQFLKELERYNKEREEKT